MGSTPGTPQSWNRFGYAGNDPLNSNDPSGRVDDAGCGADGTACLLNAGDGGTKAGGDDDCFISPFDPSPLPAPCLWVPPSQGSPTSDAPLLCDVELFSRPAGPNWDPFQHTYLKLMVTDQRTGASQTGFLEGIPTVTPDPGSAVAYWTMVALGRATPSASLQADPVYNHPPKEIYDFGGNSNICDKISQLGLAEQGYKPVLYNGALGPDS